MISVIVPIYNVEKYLPKCVESIMRQTYADLEIILVDDGSVDGCGKICEEYARADSRIRVIRKENGGVSSARNAGLEAARGEFVAFVDADDYLFEKTYEKMIGAMAETDADMAVCAITVVVDGAQPVRAEDDGARAVFNRKDAIYHLFDFDDTINLAVWNKLFKKELISLLRFDTDLSYGEDTDLLFRYLLSLKKAVKISYAGYVYNKRADSVTRAGSFAAKAKRYTVWESVYLQTVRLYPDIKAHCLPIILDSCALSYKDLKNRLKFFSGKEKSKNKKLLASLRRYVKKRAVSALFDKEIFWKTRIAYLLLK